MNEKLLYNGTLACCAMALILLIADISLATTNRKAQVDVGQRQSAIADGQSLSQLNQGLVRTLAEAALKNNNLELRDLLTSQGITLKSEPVPAPAEKPAEKK